MSCASSPMAKAVCGWCGHWRSRPTRTGSNSIATSIWTIFESTKRRRCAVPPDPRPVQPSTVLAAAQTAARRLRRWPAASLDCGCARRSAGGQVGTKGSVCSIEQRDGSFDLGSASPPPMTNLLNLPHTTFRRRDSGSGVKREQLLNLGLDRCSAPPGGVRWAVGSTGIWGGTGFPIRRRRSEPIEFEWAVIARFVQAVGLIDFAAFSRLTGEPRQGSTHQRLWAL